MSNQREPRDANDSPAHPPRGCAPLPARIAAKIIPWDRLAQVRASLRRRGRRLVQCHGCFDIVHPGHIRHLRQARALGESLLVSITADEFIAKGVGRPLIPQTLRAENLAALDCVDYVCIDHHASALDILTRVQPDVYVKGKEYETNNDPRFLAERRAVEASGGRVVFSSGDIVYSSTALIAALEHADDPYRRRLAELLSRDELSGPSLMSLLHAARGKRVVVVGECILDTYVLCERAEIAGEAPMMTLRPGEHRHFDGGAAVVARHARALGARPVLVTALGHDERSLAMRARLEADGIEVIALRVDAPLAEKQRLLVGTQKVMKLDMVRPLLLDAAAQDRFAALAADAASTGADAAIVTDFGLGLFSQRALANTCRALRPNCGILSGDVSGRRASLRALRDCDLACPSEAELRDAMQLHGEGLGLAAYRFMEETSTRRTLVTLGGEGLVSFEPAPGAPAPSDDDGAWHTRLVGEHIPALSPVAVDPLGCGDTLLTAATLALACGGSLSAAAFLGAVCASVQVQRLGNGPVSAADARQTLARLHTAHLVSDHDNEFIAPPALAAAGGMRRAG
jgi:rfaE bifunctional protein nucleotidyltransferase chain/domain